MHFASRKPRKCPACGATSVASVLWGEPILTPEVAEKLGSGTLILGGCCVSIPAAQWRCTTCKTNIYHERDRSQTKQYG